MSTSFTAHPMPGHAGGGPAHHNGTHQISATDSEDIARLIAEIKVWLSIIAPYNEMRKFSGQRFDRLVNGQTIHIRCIAGAAWLIDVWFEVEVTYNSQVYRTGRRGSSAEAVAAADLWITQNVKPM